MKTYNQIFTWITALMLTVTMMSCEKTIEVELPAYDSEMVVECYLQDGMPAKMALTRSVGYFEDPDFPEVANASVAISGDSNSFSMNYQGDDDQDFKFYNYQSDEAIDLTTGETYDIVIEDDLGNVVTGTTKILPVVPIKKHEVDHNERTGFTSINIWFDDNTAVENFYRVEVLRDTHGGIMLPEFTILYNDALEEEEEVVFTIGGEFEKGDEVIINLYHLEEQYYEFLRSAEDAESSNGNPLGQPARIRSAVNGGLGVFTTLIYDTEIVVIE